MVFSVRSVLPALVFVASAAAHFTITYPAYRGTTNTTGTDQTKFCGNLPQQTVRSPLSLTDGVIAIDAHHDEGNVAVSLSLNAAPTGFDGFSEYFTTTGVHVVKRVDFEGAGIHSFQLPDFTTLGLGITNGTVGTLLLSWVGTSNLFQCTDVVFSTVETSPTDEALGSIEPTHKLPATCA